MARVWILRSLRSPGYEELAFSDDLIAIGWDAVGDLTSLADQSQTREAVRAAFPFREQESVRSFADQLFQFHLTLAKGDLVVLLRRGSTEVAVGQVTGEYCYRDDLEPTVRHVRPVRWKRTDLPRVSVAWLLLDMPTLVMIHRVKEKDSFERLAELVDSDMELGDARPVPLGPEAQELKPFTNFKRNLDYARNLATAGDHLTQLKVGAFEVPDVFRAAWVQAVAALDHWVRQEVRTRMLWLARHPREPRPERFSEFGIPLGEVEKILRSRSSLSSLVDVIDGHLARTRGHIAYQQPDKIRDAFALVGDVTGLWNKVARVLNERLADAPTMTGTDVQDKLKSIVERRNKIAHQNDDDPENSPLKRSIDGVEVSDTIEWIELLAAAILEVLGPHPSSDG